MGGIIDHVRGSSKITLVAAALAVGSGCATIVNDPEVPVEFIPQGCESLQCTARNKRGQWQVEAPGTAMIRRSDDTLHVECTDATGGQFGTQVESEIEAEKLAGSIVFFDLGITDSITDKHRDYPRQVLIACMR